MKSSIWSRSSTTSPRAASCSISSESEMHALSRRRASAAGGGASWSAGGESGAMALAGSGIERDVVVVWSGLAPVQGGVGRTQSDGRRSIGGQPASAVAGQAKPTAMMLGASVGEES
jgi:hypothetical protein